MSDLKRSGAFRRWENDGWTIQKTRGGHLRLTHADAATPIFTASTPSDHRALKNTEALMRRAIRDRKGKEVIVETKSLGPRARRHPDKSINKPVVVELPTPRPEIFDVAPKTAPFQGFSMFKQEPKQEKPPVTYILEGSLAEALRKAMAPEKAPPPAPKTEPVPAASTKRKPGRPRKVQQPLDATEPAPTKRKPGRPRKVQQPLEGAVIEAASAMIKAGVRVLEEKKKKAPASPTFIERAVYTDFVERKLSAVQIAATRSIPIDKVIRAIKKVRAFEDA